MTETEIKIPQRFGGEIHITVDPESGTVYVAGARRVQAIQHFVCGAEGSHPRAPTIAGRSEADALYFNIDLAPDKVRCQLQRRKGAGWGGDNGPAISASIMEFSIEGTCDVPSIVPVVNADHRHFLRGQNLPLFSPEKKKVA